MPDMSMVQCFRQIKLPKLLLPATYNWGSYWAYGAGGPRFFSYMCHTSSNVKAQLIAMCQEADEKAQTDDQYAISEATWKVICEIYEHEYVERGWLSYERRDQLARRRYLRELLR